MTDSGDTGWVLVSSAMALLTTPGLAFFYGGLVRSSQVLNTIKMSFASLAIGSVVWALVGYSLAFDEGSGFVGCLVGGFGFCGLNGVTAQPNPAYGATIPHFAFAVFQMTFAVIAPAILSGAVVGRMRFKAYTLFVALWMVLVYAPLAHQVWGPGGWIGELGALDFAGGTVVHVSAGVGAVVAAAFVGRRRGSDDGSGESAHNVPLVVLGASLLWFGWFGFSAGSALAADGIAALAFTNTMLAAAAAVGTWMLIDVWRIGKPQLTGAAIGAVVGLVAIAPAAGYVCPGASMSIGALASCASYTAVALMRRSRVDDALDVFACHGIGGAAGAVLTGVFASSAANPSIPDGLLGGNFQPLLAQLIAVVAAAAVAAAGTATALLVTRAVTPLRVPMPAQRSGIDVAEHDERAYSKTWFGVAEPRPPRYRPGAAHSLSGPRTSRGTQSMS